MALMMRKNDRRWRFAMKVRTYINPRRVVDGAQSIIRKGGHVTTHDIRRVMLCDVKNE
jgi:hypothetical protein